MTRIHDGGQLDWLIDLAGASVPATAAAVAAAMLAPLNDWPATAAGLAGGGGMFIAAFIAMRCVPAEAHHLALPHFEPVALPEEELLLDSPCATIEELLLDQPLVEAATEAVAELLLDDPLPAATPDSRVVMLFADGRMPTAGQLKNQIDRHLADGAPPAAGSDASDTLSEALAELRRSLRQA